MLLCVNNKQLMTENKNILMDVDNKKLTETKI